MALDPNLFFYSDGTITLTNGSDIATGDLTAWDVAVLPFDFIFPNDGTDGMSVVKEILSFDQVKLAKPWTGPTLTDVPYFMLRWVKHTDPKVYALRVSDYLTRLKAIPENIEQVAADINDDRQAVAAAMLVLQQIEDDVEADRLAVASDRLAAQNAADAAAASATEAEGWAQAASTGVIPSNSVTNDKLADMPTARIKGRATAATGDPEDLTAAQVRALLGGFLLKRVLPFTSSGTYTPSSDVRAVWVRAVGAGAGGWGGLFSTTGGAYHTLIGFGGPAGAYGEAVITQLAASYSVIIGAAGSAGILSGSATSGGSTSFGSILSLGGGPAGSALPQGATPVIYPSLEGGVGVFTGGSGIVGFAKKGEPSSTPIRMNGDNGAGGNGGSSPFGVGGVGGRCQQSAANGADASGYGAGGGGGARSATTTGGVGINGGAGAPGYVEIWEFI